MGLGKEKGSSRINRYEHQVTAIGFDNLEKLAAVLDVPVAYLLADSAPMADAILELGKANKRQLVNLALAVKGLVAMPDLTEALTKVVQLPKSEQERINLALLSLLAGPNGKGEDA